MKIPNSNIHTHTQTTCTPEMKEETPNGIIEIKQNKMKIRQWQQQRQQQQQAASNK